VKRFVAELSSGKTIAEEYFSIGGGFVVQEDRSRSKEKEKLFKEFPHPVQTGEEVIAHCKRDNLKISDIVWENELALRKPEEIDEGIKAMWQVMLESMYEGCHTKGMLPGGLNVTRRAYGIHKKLIENKDYSNPQEWIE